jgi:hypothetical protein
MLLRCHNPYLCSKAFRLKASFIPTLVLHIAMSTTAHSLLQPSAAVVNCTNEQVDLEDAADRAERHRKHAQQRVNLRQVGFWPKNRGGVGVSSTHIHEVCSDIRTNKIRRQRYEPLQLLAVPEGPMLEKFKAANKSKCTSDPLMPAFSEEMKYVAATKTHFVHACKLFCEGSHHFYNKPQNPKIRFKAGDKEAAEIQSEGILAVIYGETIWNDMGAVEALCAIGNFNAQIDQSEDEMQAFGRINELVNRLPGVALKDARACDIVLKELQEASGLGHFPPEQWKHLIALRLTLPASWAKMMMTVQFHSEGGRIRLKSTNFKEVSKLYIDAPWVKVAIMLYGYGLNDSSQGSHKRKADEMTGSSDATDISFVERSETYARDVSVGCLKELKAEVWLQQRFELFIKNAITHYGNPDLTACDDSGDFAMTALINARGRFLARCGGRIIRTSSVLFEKVKEKKQVNQTLSPAEREAVLCRKQVEQHLAKLETSFRESLVKYRMFHQNSLPGRMIAEFKEVVAAHSLDAVPKRKGSQIVEKEVAQVLDPKILQGDVDDAASGSASGLTDQAVFERLSITGLREQVFVLIDEEAIPICTQGIETDDEPMPDAQPIIDPSWKEGILCAIELPFVFVEILAGKKTEKYKVLECKLRAREAAKDDKPLPPLHPSLRPQGVELRSIDWARAAEEYRRQAVNISISDLVGSHKKSSDGVATFRQNPITSSPLSLTCRATQRFTKYTLTLIPGNSWVQLVGLPKEDQEQRKKSNLHTSMVSKMRGEIQETVHQDGRYTKTQQIPPRKTEYELISPFVKEPWQQGKSVPQVHPFWSVIRCKSPKSVHNMEVCMQTFIVPHISLRGGPKNMMVTTVSLPVLRNCEVLEVEDVLTVPWEDEDEEKI